MLYSWYRKESRTWLVYRSLTSTPPQYAMVPGTRNRLARGETVMAQDIQAIPPPDLDGPVDVSPVCRGVPLLYPPPPPEAYQPAAPAPIRPVQWWGVWLVGGFTALRLWTWHQENKRIERLEFLEDQWAQRYGEG